MHLVIRIPESAIEGRTKSGRGEHFDRGEAWRRKSPVAQRYSMLEAVPLPGDFLSSTS
jgi:hypothetical protein